jgi:hypothetical protein
LQEAQVATSRPEELDWGTAMESATDGSAFVPGQSALAGRLDV